MSLSLVFSTRPREPTTPPLPSHCPSCQATRQSPEWEYVKETQHLKGALAEIAARAKKTQEVKLQAAKQTQQAMQYLQVGCLCVSSLQRLGSSCPCWT